VPVRVSYKKQFVLMTMLLITLLAVVELGANIWLYNFYHCDFEESEIFKDVDSETKKKICLENVEYDFTKQTVSWENGTRTAPTLGGLDENLVYINSEGFRSPEFTKIKLENTYRIFTVGGSTTMGAGVLDNQTYPFYLQEIYDTAKIDFDVEVINVGWPTHNSLLETDLIKTKLLDFEPDLFIVFDGWNDVVQEIRGNKELSASLWGERWMKICELGKQFGFDTIVTIQPHVGTGTKILTNQENEQKIGLIKGKLPVNYPEYVKELNKLKPSCTLTADLRNIFDDVKEPLYYDVIHVGPKGNQILAEKFYALSLPIVIEGARNLDLNSDNELGAVRNMNVELISNDENDFSEEVYLTVKNLISPYKTPKVIPLIFE